MFFPVVLFPVSILWFCSGQIESFESSQTKQSDGAVTLSNESI